MRVAKTLKWLTCITTAYDIYIVIHDLNILYFSGVAATAAAATNATATTANTATS